MEISVETPNDTASSTSAIHTQESALLTSFESKNIDFWIFEMIFIVYHWASKAGKNWMVYKLFLRTVINFGD